jgi:hypothetical protein
MSIEEEFIKVLGDDDYIDWGTLCGQNTPSRTKKGRQC